MPKKRPRVVITGMGVTSVFGTDLEEYWESLLAGRSGIRKITYFDPSNLPCQIAGEITSFDPDDFFSRKEARRIPKESQFALTAAIKAVEQSGLPKIMPNPERAGVVIGTALSGTDSTIQTYMTYKENGYRQLSPFVGLGTIPNYSAFLIGQHFQCQGPNSTITTACAASTQSIGDAAELIRRGAADIVISGGTEALIVESALGVFSSMRALPTSYNDQPTKASRPFDAKREGFVPSEGAAILIFENKEHAESRGAKIYAEVAGHGSSNDAYHVSAPSPDGSGPARAMKWAIEDANLSPQDIDYINAHGTSTQLNDQTETRAIKALFGESAYDVAISSTKSMVGHAMGASGALEAVASVMAINHSKIPPTINFEYPDPELDLDYTPNKSREKEINAALSNSFGLGGQNSCVVLKKYSG